MFVLNNSETHEGWTTTNKFFVYLISTASNLWNTCAHHLISFLNAQNILNKWACLNNSWEMTKYALGAALTNVVVFTMNKRECLLSVSANNCHCFMFVCFVITSNSVNYRTSGRFVDFAILPEYVNTLWKFTTTV